MKALSAPALRQLRLKLLSLLDQKVGREKSVLRKNIRALELKIRKKEQEKQAMAGYHKKGQKLQAPGEGRKKCAGS